jgi:hypothetical protein
VPDSFSIHTPSPSTSPSAGAGNYAGNWSGEREDTFDGGLTPPLMSPMSSDRNQDWNLFASFKTLRASTKESAVRVDTERVDERRRRAQTPGDLYRGHADQGSGFTYYTYNPSIHNNFQESSSNKLI